MFCRVCVRESIYYVDFMNTKQIRFEQNQNTILFRWTRFKFEDARINLTSSYSLPSSNRKRAACWERPFTAMRERAFPSLKDEHEPPSEIWDVYSPLGSTEISVLYTIEISPFPMHDFLPKLLISNYSPLATTNCFVFFRLPGWFIPYFLLFFWIPSSLHHMCALCSFPRCKTHKTKAFTQMSRNFVKDERARFTMWAGLRNVMFHWEYLVRFQLVTSMLSRLSRE